MQTKAILLAAASLLGACEAWASTDCISAYAEVERDAETKTTDFKVQLGIGVRFALKRNGVGYKEVPRMPIVGSFRGNIRARFAADGVDCTDRSAVRTDLIALVVTDGEALTVVTTPAGLLGDNGASMMAPLPPAPAPSAPRPQ